jgi:hypothetical protein
VPSIDDAIDNLSIILDLALQLIWNGLFPFVLKLSEEGLEVLARCSLGVKSELKAGYPPIPVKDDKILSVGID